MYWEKGWTGNLNDACNAGTCTLINNYADITSSCNALRACFNKQGVNTSGMEDDCSRNSVGECFSVNVEVEGFDTLPAN